jgi:hypothetical protein
MRVYIPRLACVTSMLSLIDSSRIAGKKRLARSDEPNGIMSGVVCEQLFFRGEGFGIFALRYGRRSAEFTGTGLDRGSTN